MTRVCSNPDCAHKGEPQPIENFHMYQGKWRRGECKVCYTNRQRAYYLAHRDQLLEGKRRIPDDDPETDLVPTRFGIGAWKMITR